MPTNYPSFKRRTSLFKTMLSFSSRCVTRIDRCKVLSLGGEEWVGISKSGRGMMFTTGPGAAPSPVDYMLLAVGACAGHDVQFLLNENKKPFDALDIKIEGEFVEGTPRRMKEIRVHVDPKGCEATKEEIAKITSKVLTTTCPVAITLTTKPKLSAKASIVPSKK